MSTFNAFAFRPCVTQLDDRLVPSVSPITGDLRSLSTHLAIVRPTPTPDTVFVGTSSQQGVGEGDDSSVHDSEASTSDPAKPIKSSDKHAAAVLAFVKG